MERTFTVELTEREMELLSQALNDFEPLDENGELDEQVTDELDELADKLTNATAGLPVVMVLVENDSLEIKAKSTMPIELKVLICGECPGEEAQAANDASKKIWDETDLPEILGEYL